MAPTTQNPTTAPAIQRTFPRNPKMNKEAAEKMVREKERRRGNVTPLVEVTKGACASFFCRGAVD